MKLTVYKRKGFVSVCRGHNDENMGNVCTIFMKACLVVSSFAIVLLATKIERVTSFKGQEGVGLTDA